MKEHIKEEIISKPDLIIHHNAFIKPNGNFYISDCYDELSTPKNLEIFTTLVTKDFQDNFEEKVKLLLNKAISNNNKKLLVKLQSILIHYYGYSLFCRYYTNQNPNRFYDASIIPNPKYFNLNATKQQKETLSSLFELNDDSSFMQVNQSHKTLKRVLNHQNIFDEHWHGVIEK